MPGYSDTQLRQESVRDVLPETAAFVICSTFDSNGRCGSGDGVGGAGIVLAAQSVNGPSGGIDNAKTVAFVYQDGKVSGAAIGDGRSSFEYAGRVLPESVHIYPIGQVSGTFR